MTRPTKTRRADAARAINKENAIQDLLSAAQCQRHDDAEKHSTAAEHDDGRKRELRAGHGGTSKTVLTVLVQLG